MGNTQDYKKSGGLGRTLFLRINLGTQTVNNTASLNTTISIIMVEERSFSFDNVAQVAITMATASTSPMLLSNPSLAWAIINLLQIFYYLLFFNVAYPNNVQRILKLFSIARLSFIPNIFPSGWLEQEKYQLESPPKFAENELTGFFLQNGGSILTLWVSLSFAYLAFFLAQYALGPESKIIKKLKPYFSKSTLFKLLTGTQLELLLAGVLQCRVLSFKDGVLALSSILGIVVTILVVGSVYFSYKLVTNAANRRGKIPKDFPFLEDYQLKHKVKRWAGVLLFIRRCLHMVFLVAFYYIPWLQVASVWLLNTLYGAYILI